MKLNKTIAKTLVFALALGSVSFFGGQTVKANSTAPTADNLKFSAVKSEIIISSDNNAKFWGVAKVVKDEKSANISITADSGKVHYKVSEVNPVLETTIDLSTLPSKKDAFIAVGSTEIPDSTNWIVKKISAGNTYFNLEYLSSKKSKAKKVVITEGDFANKALGNDENGYLVVSKEKEGTAGTLSTEAATIEVKAGNGAWTAFNTFFGGVTNEAVGTKLGKLVTSGKKLKFRQKVADDAPSAWVSNEVSISVNAKPKAPSVKVDIKKDIVQFKKGLEYKILPTGTNAADIAWVEADGKKSFKDLQFYKESNDGIGDKGGTILIRSKADDKKLSSQETTLTIAKLTKPNVNVTIDNQGKDIIADAVSLNLKAKEDISKGAILENKSTTKNYEYYVSYTGEVAENPSWKLLPKATTKKNNTITKKVTLKYSTTEKKDSFGPSGTKIFIRESGVTQNGNAVTLPSPNAVATISLKKIPQDITAAAGSSADTKLTEVSVNTSKLAITAKEKSSHTLKYTLSNIQNPKKSLKVKVTNKVSGVTVKVGKFTKESDNGNAIITVNVSKSAFKDAGTHSFKFLVSGEGAEAKEHTMTITVAAPAKP